MLPAIALVAVLAAPPQVWHWGPVSATNAAGRAHGLVTLDGSVFTVSGRLTDTGKGCSWLAFRWTTDVGAHRSKTIKNCSNRALKFAFKPGTMLSMEGRVCRGTSTKPTGRCSGWDGVWAQGG